MQKIEPIDGLTLEEQRHAELRGYLPVKLHTVLEPEMLQKLYELCEATPRWGKKKRQNSS